MNAELKFSIGDPVYHYLWGGGEVVFINDKDNSSKVVIDFYTEGRKTLLTSFCQPESLINLLPKQND